MSLFVQSKSQIIPRGWRYFIRHLERSEAESKFAKWSEVKWSKPTERSEGEIYEGSPIPHRGDVTSLFHRAQGTVVYGDVVSVIVYRSLRITARRYASVLLCSAWTRRVKLRLRGYAAPIKMTHRASFGLCGSHRQRLNFKTEVGEAFRLPSCQGPFRCSVSDLIGA